MLVAGGVGLMVMVRLLLFFKVSIIFVGVDLMHVGRIIGALVDIVIVFIVDVVVGVCGK